jgi:spermidine synthase
MRRFGSRASLLYAVNTAGAIAGALAAGFYLVPFVGLTRAFFIAAGTNVIIGSVALLISPPIARRA